MAMAIWLSVILALFQGSLLKVQGADVVYSPAEGYDQNFELPLLDIETTTDYSDPGEKVEEPKLTCFDCTSYMPECKRVVSDREGLIVSKAGCKSKCFLRVGEEKNGALYRGCMDDFVSASLDTSYIGCKVQEWNGRKSLWCLCGDDLCNGESLKSLFYYGYGQGQGTVAFEEPAEIAHLEPISTVDAEFDQMTDSLDNYNSHYSFEPKIEAKKAFEDGNYAAEPLHPITTSLPKYLEPIDEPAMTIKAKPGVTQLKEEFHQPDPHYFPPVPVRFPTTHRDPLLTYGQKSAHYPASTENPHKTTKSGHYAFLPTYDFPVAYYYPPPGFHPYLSAYPPQLNQYIKPQPQPESHSLAPLSLDSQDLKYSKPEGKSAGTLATLSKLEGGVSPEGQYQDDSYQDTSADFDLEPVSYFPYEEKDQDPETNKIDSLPDYKTDFFEEPEVTQELVKDVDTDLYCPSAGIFTYEEDCSKFVMCLIDHLKGRPRMYVMKCPGGLVFDSRANTCMQPELSDGCRRLKPEDRDTYVTPSSEPRPIEYRAPSHDEQQVGSLYQEYKEFTRNDEFK